MRVVAIIQARMGSTRLPGKVLEPIGDRPMLAHVVERAMRIPGVRGAIVAIPDLSEDDVLQEALVKLGVPFTRGPADDVLARYEVALDAAGPDTEGIVRITADCPLLSPEVSGRVVAGLAGADYVSNTLDRTYPRGLDTEAVRVDALRLAAREARSPAEREHVTPFIWRRPQRFRLTSIRDDVDRSHLRWTVDLPEDLATVRAIYAELGPDIFDLEAIYDLVGRRPELATMNASVEQKRIGS